MEQGSYRWEIDDQPATVVIADAVSSITETPHERLEPIHESIDGESLDALVDHADDVRVCFEYAGFEIEVTPDEVRLNERESR